MFTVDDVFMPKDETLNVSDDYYYCSHHIFVMPLIATVDIYAFIVATLLYGKGSYWTVYNLLCVHYHTIQQRV